MKTLSLSCKSKAPLLWRAIINLQVPLTVWEAYMMYCYWYTYFAFHCYHAHLHRNHLHHGLLEGLLVLHTSLLKSQRLVGAKQFNSFTLPSLLQFKDGLVHAQNMQRSYLWNISSIVLGRYLLPVHLY